MKKTLMATVVAMLFFACSKDKQPTTDSANANSPDGSSQRGFNLNNLRAEAAQVNAWLSNSDFNKVVLCFYSSNMALINSNLTMSAYPYEKDKDYPATAPVVLSIASTSNLPIEANTVFTNNIVTISAIKKAVTDNSGNVNFDYLVFTPVYQHYDGKSYLTYKLIAYKNGSPVKSTQTDDGLPCDATKPSPPATPCDDDGGEE